MALAEALLPCRRHARIDFRDLRQEVESLFRETLAIGLRPSIGGRVILEVTQQRPSQAEKDARRRPLQELARCEVATASAALGQADGHVDVDHGVIKRRRQLADARDDHDIRNARGVARDRDPAGAAAIDAARQPYCPRSWKLCGAGSITVPAPRCTSSTPNPRCTSPSGRSRKIPSTPLKPLGLVSVASEKSGCGARPRTAASAVAS